MSTLSIRCVISVSWANLDVLNPPSIECTLAVQEEAYTQIPSTVLAEWGAATITVEDDGTIPKAALMDYAQSKIDALNSAREARNPELPDFAIAGDGPEECHYTYELGQRICFYAMNLTLGGAPWSIPDPLGQTANPKLNMGLQWSLSQA